MYHTQKLRTVDEFAVIDLDRTLVNTIEITNMVLESLVNYGVKSARIDTMREYVNTQKGSSFDLFEYIQHEVPSVSIKRMTRELLALKHPLSAKQRLLCGGAERLISTLRGADVPFVVLTYGKPDYQEFKVRLLRNLLELSPGKLPAIVTDSQNKSDWVQKAWFAQSGLGVVPANVTGEMFHVRKAIIIDDKPSHLQSSDERVLGILVNNEGKDGDMVPSTARVADAVEEGISLTDTATVCSDAFDERAG